MKTKQNEGFDETVSRRLAKLGAMPVDTSRLDRVLRAQLPAAPGMNWRRVIRPIAALAASLVLVLAIGFGLLQERRVQASPSDMVRWHMDVVSGRIATMDANNIEDANRAIAAFAGGGLRLPEMPESMQRMSCCMGKVRDKQVVSVLLKNQSAPVTLTVANGAAMDSAGAPTIEHNGTAYHVVSENGVNMVSCERQGHWVCLIGGLPKEQLMDLADTLRF